MAQVQEYAGIAAMLATWHIQTLQGGETRIGQEMSVLSFCLLILLACGLCFKMTIIHKQCQGQF
jgi:hypothetical protein